VVCRVLTRGTVARLDMQYLVAGNGSLRLIGYNASGATLFTSSTVTNVNANPLRAQLILRQTGSDIFWALFPFPVISNSNLGNAVSGTLSTASVGNATQVIVNPDGHLDDTAAGHVVVQYNYTDSLDDTEPLLAWSTEIADIDYFDDFGDYFQSRFSRLCAEQNVASVIAPAGDISVFGTFEIGYQTSDSFLNLIQEPVNLTLGLLFESKDQHALVLRPRPSLYNQAAKLTLNFSAHQLSGPLDPVDDDALTRNDVTVTGLADPRPSRSRPRVRWRCSPSRRVSVTTRRPTRYRSLSTTNLPTMPGGGSTWAPWTSHGIRRSPSTCGTPRSRPAST
jgi:hypothetical protein